MNKFEMIRERFEFLGVNCEELLKDIEFILSEGKREGNRRKEVMEILEREKNGISGKEIGKELNIKGPNVASVVMEIRRNGEEVFNVNGKYVLGRYVNIG